MSSIKLKGISKKKRDEKENRILMELEAIGYKIDSGNEGRDKNCKKCLQSIIDAIDLGDEIKLVGYTNETLEYLAKLIEDYMEFESEVKGGMLNDGREIRNVILEVAVIVRDSMDRWQKARKDAYDSGMTSSKDIFKKYLE